MVPEGRLLFPSLSVEENLLAGVDLELAAGETAAVIGANGAGKSTFLRTVMGQHPAAKPCVTIRAPAEGGADLRNLPGGRAESIQPRHQRGVQHGRDVGRRRTGA